MKARIVIAASYDAFIELAEMIKYSLNEINLRTKGVPFDKIVIQDDAQISTRDLYDLNFIIRAFRPFSAECLQGGPKILFQTEECWNNREKGAYRWELTVGCVRVLEMYDENCKLKDTEKVHYCPVGYSPVWEKNLPEVEEDIDVFFHGSFTPRRAKFCSMLEAAGYNVKFTVKKGIFGIEREKMIMRSKVVLNIKAHDKWSYGPLHCLPTQCQKKFMLAERANGGYGPFRPGIHLQEYDGLTDCLEKVDYWISHEKERKEFSVSAYESMLKDCNFTNIFAKAMRGLL
jgi:hypothetical protein